MVCADHVSIEMSTINCVEFHEFLTKSNDMGFGVGQVIKFVVFAISTEVERKQSKIVDTSWSCLRRNI